MAVFSQIKNFIKSGKSFSSMGSRNSVHNPYEAASRIVHEENIARQKMPVYAGLEEYELKAKLGDGAFSKVYEAVNVKTQERVAIKVVRKSELNSQQHYFLVLELCDGGELFHQIVRLTYFSEDLSRHCIRQVAEGIRYLHQEKGVGEFIPGIGGGGIGQVKIADFGLSKVVWDQHTMTPCGTVGYTAPEIVKDQRYTKPVDMWALGCVLYTLLCGFPPFYDESIQVLTAKVTRGEYTFLSPWWDNISVEAKDIIEHLLCVDPSERFTIDEFLDHPWMQNKVISCTKLEEVNMEAISAKTSAIDLPSLSSLSHQEYTVPSQPETEAELFKRMIQDRIRDELELEAAVPHITSSGVSSVINSCVNSRSNSRAPSVVASGTTTPRRDLYSGVTSMKEMFDISYAVHRMAEEKTHRRNMKLQSQLGNEDIITHRSLFMAGIHSADDDGMEETSDMTADETSSSQTASECDQEMEELNNELNAVHIDGPRKDEDNDRKRHKGRLFELNMENATLLGKRKCPAISPIDTQEQISHK
ncbi:kinase-like domain-containing protein [Pilobolus umbonatus]|nr:kinase-like domain-containing protein [Pilobolus umbonatus]